jgi:hypothetical protein
MAVWKEQRVEDGQLEPGRTSNTGAWKPDTVAVISPWIFPCKKSVISCPGATIVGGYRYPNPATVSPTYSGRMCGIGTSRVFVELLCLVRRCFSP